MSKDTLKITHGASQRGDNPIPRCHVSTFCDLSFEIFDRWIRLRSSITAVTRSGRCKVCVCAFKVGESNGRRESERSKEKKGEEG